MLRDKETSKQKEYEIVLLDDLVPQDHILRKIDAAVDFSFIHDLCKDLYSPNIGRPAIEPELLFRMLFLGYLYGIKSETKLAQEVNENIAFKWFLGLRLTEKGPDHSTISANRVRRFRDHNIAEKIFDNILQQCIDRKLVGGNILYTDSTHIKAKANKHRKTLVHVEETPKEYLEELNAQINLDRRILGKKPFDHDDDDKTPKSGGGKTQMKSLTDPESGQQNREGKPDGFHYSEHRTVDSKNNVIVNGVFGRELPTARNLSSQSIADEHQVRLGEFQRIHRVKFVGLFRVIVFLWIDCKRCFLRQVFVVVGFGLHSCCFFRTVFGFRHITGLSSRYLHKRYQIADSSQLKSNREKADSLRFFHTE